MGQHAACVPEPPFDPMPGPAIELADLTWQQAERLLTPEAVVMIPLGAAAKEHGPHLRLDNDLRLAEALKRRVMARARVVVAPTVNYHHYPAFTAYPGSVSLRADTARDLLVDIVAGLAAFGPRRFYVLNTGISTCAPLEAAAEALAAEGVLLHYTDLVEAVDDVERRVAEQARGSHADEIETSMMLCLHPERVDMDLAVKDDNPRNGRGGFSREPGRSGIYSPSGVWGDPTLASVEKGRIVVDALVDAVLADIARLAGAGLPV